MCFAVKRIVMGKTDNSLKYVPLFHIYSYSLIKIRTRDFNVYVHVININIITK